MAKKLRSFRILSCTVAVLATVAIIIACGNGDPIDVLGDKNIDQAKIQLVNDPDRLSGIAEKTSSAESSSSEGEIDVDSSGSGDVDVSSGGASPPASSASLPSSSAAEPPSSASVPDTHTLACAITKANSSLPAGVKVTKDKKPELTCTEIAKPSNVNKLDADDAPDAWEKNPDWRSPQEGTYTGITVRIDKGYPCQYLKATCTGTLTITKGEDITPPVIPPSSPSQSSPSVTPSSPSVTPSSPSGGDCAYQSSWCGGNSYTSNTDAKPANGACVFVSDYTDLTTSSNGSPEILINGTSCSGTSKNCATSKPAKKDGGYYIYVKSGISGSAAYTVTKGSPSCSGSGGSTPTPTPSSTSSGGCTASNNTKYCYYGSKTNCYKMPTDDCCDGGLLVDNCDNAKVEYCDYGVCEGGDGWDCANGGCYVKKSGDTCAGGSTVTSCPKNHLPPSAQ